MKMSKKIFSERQVPSIELYQLDAKSLIVQLGTRCAQQCTHQWRRGVAGKDDTIGLSAPAASTALSTHSTNCSLITCGAGAAVSANRGLGAAERSTTRGAGSTRGFLKGLEASCGNIPCTAY